MQSVLLIWANMNILNGNINMFKMFIKRDLVYTRVSINTMCGRISDSCMPLFNLFVVNVT